MQSIDFSVQGSSPEPYVVSFRYSAPDLKISCTCPAGVKKQVCKHRLNILTGVLDGLVSQNHDQVGSVQEWVKGSPLAEAMEEVAKAEAAQEAATVQLKVAKKRLGLAMG